MDMGFSPIMYLLGYVVEKWLFQTMLAASMMGSARVLPFIGSRYLVEYFGKVNIIPALKGKMRQCLLHIVKTDTPVIVLEYLSNVIDFVGRSICLFHIADM